MRRIFRLALLFLVSIPAASTARAEDGALVEAFIPHVRPDGILETADGRALRLSGIRLPAAVGPRWRDMEAESTAFMTAWLDARMAAAEPLRILGNGRDRWGRIRAIVRAGTDSLAIALLKAGLAVVDGRDAPAARVEALLAAEATGRAAGAGLWGRGYRVYRADEPVPEGLFGIVEGRVHAVAKVRGRTYVNFSADWGSDFTVLLDSAARRAFTAADMAPETLEGALVRVRGITESWNGPLIRVNTPRDVELRDLAAG